MTDYVNEYLDRKITLAEALAAVKEKTYISSGEGAEARKCYEEQLGELKTYVAVFYMKEHGYTCQEGTGKWLKKD